MKIQEVCTGRQEPQKICKNITKVFNVSQTPKRLCVKIQDVSKDRQEPQNICIYIYIYIYICVSSQQPVLCVRVCCFAHIAPFLNTSSAQATARVLRPHAPTPAPAPPALPVPPAPAHGHRSHNHHRRGKARGLCLRCCLMLMRARTRVEETVFGLLRPNNPPRYVGPLAGREYDSKQHHFRTKPPG